MPQISKNQASPSPKRRTQLQLGVERLEPRLLMNADNGAALPDNDITLTVDVAAPILTILPPVVSDAMFRDFDADFWYPQFNETPHEVAANLKTEKDVRDWIIRAIDQKYGELFGTEVSQLWYGWGCSCLIDEIVAFDTDLSLRATSAGMSNSFSETNVQVAGVDEADLIETDGEFLYLVSGNELLIIDATRPDDLSIASRIRLKQPPTGIYLSGDRLTLISSGEPTDQNGALRSGTFPGYRPRESATSSVTVLDIADRTQPTQVQKTTLPGRVVSSRMVEGQLRLVLQEDRFDLPMPKDLPATDPQEGATSTIYESREEYLDRELDELVDRLLLTGRSYSLEEAVVQRDQLIQPEQLNGLSLSDATSRTTITTFDVQADQPGPADSYTLFSAKVDRIYATQESLYLAGNSSSYSHRNTTIWKFELSTKDHSIELAAKGEVEGTLLNQFSLDEHEGYLRVVVSEPGWPGGHSLHVLKQSGEKLKITGSVESLAPGERLHSVRFLGEQAFFVTFRKVDPLFAIDLTNPKSPVLAGELKIPGYSDYLQPIGENHLLGIGRGADEQRGLFEEMQLSIFDTTDLDDPQLAHRYSIQGGRNTTSIATGNRWRQGDGDHHAVSYFPEQGILAIPLESEGDRLRWKERGQRADPGLQVFSVSTETGFEPLATISHDSPVLRSLRIGQSLLVYSAGEITSHELASPANQLDRLSLLVGSDVGLVDLSAHGTTPVAGDLQALAIHAEILSDTPMRSAVIDALHRAAPVAGELTLATANQPVFGQSALHSQSGGINVRDLAFADSGLSEIHLATDQLIESLLEDLTGEHWGLA